MLWVVGQSPNFLNGLLIVCLSIQSLKGQKGHLCALPTSALLASGPISCDRDGWMQHRTREDFLSFLGSLRGTWDMEKWTSPSQRAKKAEKGCREATSSERKSNLCGSRIKDQIETQDSSALRLWSLAVLKKIHSSLPLQRLYHFHLMVALCIDYVFFLFLFFRILDALACGASNLERLLHSGLANS